MKNLLVSAAFLLLACNCGSSSSGGGTPDSGPGAPTLTVTSFDGWCTVEVNSAPLSSTGTYNFTPGTVVNLSATANAGFMWGYWRGTDGANAGNAGKDPNMVTTVTTVDADQSVVACCPSATLKCP